jgi:hypothetical protein
VQTGGITAALGDTIQLSGESTVGWTDNPNAPVARWEISSYPPGFPCPAGWSTDVNGTYYVLTNISPPSFTADASRWGKYTFRLFVGGGIKNGVASSDMEDKSTALSVPSPSGLLDLAAYEGQQFGGAARAWTADIQTNWRTIDEKISILSGSGTTATIGGPTYTIVELQADATNGEVMLSAAASDGSGFVAVKSAFFTLFDKSGITAANWTLAGTGTTSLMMGPQVTSVSIGQTQRTGTGANAGAPMSIIAQQGQQQSGANNNNNGASLTIGSGKPGTGGGGSAGLAGTLNLKAGNAVVFQADGLGFVTVSATSTWAVNVAGPNKISANVTGLAFYANTPVAQAARVGQLTDSSAGTPGTTLSAIGGTTYSTDAPTLRNWIASVAAKLNAIETAIHNIGLTA